MKKQKKISKDTKETAPRLDQANGADRHHEWIKVSDIVVDDRYQRPLSDRKVKEIAANFDPDAFGDVYLSKRATGKYVVLDGQHRLAVMDFLGWADQSVPALVYEGLSLSDEAKIFWKCNSNRAKPKAIYTFKARLMAKDPVALDIKKIVEGVGLKIATVNTEAGISAVSALEEIYKNGSPDRLRDTLLIVKACWGNEPLAYRFGIIRGMYAFLGRYTNEIDPKRLIKQLQQVSIIAIQRDARVFAQLSHMNLTTAVASVMVEAYNKRLTRGRLKPWTKEVEMPVFPKERIEKAMAEKAVAPEVH